MGHSSSKSYTLSPQGSYPSNETKIRQGLWPTRRVERVSSKPLKNQTFTKTLGRVFGPSLSLPTAPARRVVGKSFAPRNQKNAQVLVVIRVFRFVVAYLMPLRLIQMTLASNTANQD